MGRRHTRDRGARKKRRGMEMRVDILYYADCALCRAVTFNARIINNPIWTNIGVILTSASNIDYRYSNVFERERVGRMRWEAHSMGSMPASLELFQSRAPAPKPREP